MLEKASTKQKTVAIADIFVFSLFACIVYKK